MTETKMQLVDWLDDLCVRFIINLPQEELVSVERICFQVEEAQWFYEDFIRPLDPTLPSLNLKKFCLLIFQHCPLLSGFSPWHHVAAYEEFLSYKTRVPVRGAIMLNDAMDEVVLVKGWKKGARWSFPRGKINKDEKDLDCAVREVYEETGFDIVGAGLVQSEEEMKYIEVSMREQHMRLYVFRGVAKDTYFEPKTRKEISDIQWYKLADLPTVKRKNQQQAITEDAYKGSQFYMVAPFLGPLKGWIKDQRRRDRKAPQTQHVTAAANSRLENGEIEALEELNADGRLEDKVHMDRLMDHLRSSKDNIEPENLPEVSSGPSQVSQQQMDPSTALKRLLSVGTAPAEAQELGQTSPPAQSDLLALLLGDQHAAPSITAGGNGALPQTPFDQITQPPCVPRSPHHQHPKPPHWSNMPPPPAFPVSGAHGAQHTPPLFPLGYQSLAAPTQAARNGGPSLPTAISHPPQPQPQPRHIPVQTPWYPRPSAVGATSAGIHRPYEQTRDSMFNPGDKAPAQASAVPKASQLPAPKLTAHTMGLLSAFKAPAPPQAGPAPINSHSGVASDSHHTNRDSRYAGHRPTPSSQNNTELDLVNLLKGGQKTAVRGRPTGRPEQAQTSRAEPEPSHQQTLLNLFRKPSLAAPAPPVEKAATPLSPEPVELSATASPGVTPKAFGRAPREYSNEKTNLFISGTSNVSSKENSRRSSATISGPINVPDFETVRRHSRNGFRDSSAKPESRVAPHISILARPKAASREATSRSPPVPVHSISPKTKLEAPKPFHPQILRRGQTLATSPPPIGAPSRTPPSQASDLPSQLPNKHPNLFDRRGSQAKDQRSALLSLFGKPSGGPATSATARAATPATPENAAAIASQIVSPVSPLPDRALHAPPGPDTTLSSRISSITSAQGASAVSSISGPVARAGSRSEAAAVLAAGLAGSGAGTVPNGGVPAMEKVSSMPPPPKPEQKTRQGSVAAVNRDFLLGYLESVVKGGK